MPSQPLTSLRSDNPIKRDVVLTELDNLQKIKGEQTKQMLSEIRSLTVKRNLLLKQVKELYGVIEKGKEERNKIIKDTGVFAQAQMEKLGITGPPKTNCESPTSIISRGIIN